jgi:hypothetical protein
MIPLIARLAAVCALAIGFSATLFAQPDPVASKGFDTYIGALEARLIQNHRASEAFLAPVNLPQAAKRLQNGEMLIENLTPNPDPNLPGALLFHWRGTAYAPGAKAADFERRLRDFPNYPKVFAPQVQQSKILSQDGDHLQARMRVRQHHVITVVLDTTYDVTFGRLDPARGYSLSRSTQICEIEAAGTPSEHALEPTKAHGFMWRLNTYWSWEERDGGLSIQIESVSLTRAIPPGLGWAIRPFVESIPRESLEFTLTSAARALRKEPDSPGPSDKPVPQP